ncbi:MAG: P-loop NTPase fold protein [Allosphingosinicella sp.]
MTAVDPGDVSNQSFWFVGASWDGASEDQTARFLEEGVWENGYADRFLDEVRAMQPGERIAIKSTFTQRYNLPFDVRGLPVSVMRIKAVGTIVDNPGTGGSVAVEWQQTEERDWYFYTNRQTVWRVRPTSENARALLSFAFGGDSQNYDWWLSQPHWAERYGEGAQPFAWTRFYEALADQLSLWSDRRDRLADHYHALLSEAGAAFGGDRLPDGSQAPLEEIDPFTFIGIFNRNYRSDRRRGIAADVAEILDVDERPPDDFAGIPTLNYARTRFFADVRERNRLTIDRLWEVLHAALDLRNADDEAARARFIAAYDSAQLSKGVGSNLGIGLFWVCPWRLPSLDRYTKEAIEAEFGIVLKGTPSGAAYLDLADRLIASFGGESRFNSIPHLVREARAIPTDGSGEEEQEDEEEVEEEVEEGEEEEVRSADKRDTRFVSDDAETERDGLGRGVMAIALANQLHQIWRKANPDPPSSRLSDDRAAFVVHVDAPWGGGKTTFAHFISAVLNPASGPGGRAAGFLQERYGDAYNFAELIVDREAPADHRRPWITVWFNAWQAEHCKPPWWVFYQAIRKQCFAALAREGDAAMHPGRPGGWRRSPFSFVPGAAVAGWLWLQEILWRLWNPKIRSLLATTALCLVLVWLLFEGKLLGLGEKGGVELLVQNGVGFGLGAIGTISFIWAAGAVLTESIMPGTDSWSEKLSLGSGDPFDRFRRHFRRMLEEIRRPVMVVVDDLDRCRPEFVVDLVRGMQTLLRSPRVVFVILGDRTWIERSFETHHESMNDGQAEFEQNFGARFVAKAIQMSFVLPVIDRQRQESYVEDILFDGRARTGMSSAPDLSAAVAAREALAKTGAEASDSAVKAAAARDGRALPAGFEQALQEERGIAATTSPEVEAGIRHRLQSLASCLPPNPRQIKRIINAVTMYHAIAYQKGLPVDQEGPALALAAWVVLMSEWPASWRLLASRPQFLNLLAHEDPASAIEAAEAQVTAGFRDELLRLARDERLVSLIRGDGEARAPLTAGAVNDFLDLTPVYVPPTAASMGGDPSRAPLTSA